MFTIEPWFFFSSRAAAWERKSGAFRFVPTRSSHAFSVISPSGVA
jgi:hypothetical protein